MGQKVGARLLYDEFAKSSYLRKFSEAICHGWNVLLYELLAASFL